MMKLDTMSMLMLACEGQPEGPFVQAIPSPWSYDRRSVRFVRVNANAVFAFQPSGQHYFLRFNHATERTREAIRAELDFVHTLAQHDVRVAMPIPSLTGKLVESIETRCGLLHAVVFMAMR